MKNRIANHPTRPDAPLADFELGFDQGEQAAPRRHKVEGGGKRGFKADEADVTGDQGHRLCDLVGRQITGVRPLEDDDALIFTQSPGELPVTDIDGVNPGRAARQEDISKSPGRRAEIEADPSGDIDAEVGQGVIEFDAAP